MNIEQAEAALKEYESCRAIASDFAKPTSDMLCAAEGMNAIARKFVDEHAAPLLAEVKRLRAGIELAYNAVLVGTNDDPEHGLNEACAILHDLRMETKGETDG